MAAITTAAAQFFERCENGQGWAACAPYCKPGASFAAQAEPLAGIDTLQGYADWMQGLLSFMPDGRYETKSFATDDATQTVCAYATFHATHTGEGGPCPATGKATSTDYVYVMKFKGGLIAHMTKIWNAGWAMRELGWS